MMKFKRLVLAVLTIAAVLFTCEITSCSPDEKSNGKYLGAVSINLGTVSQSSSEKFDFVVYYDNVFVDTDGEGSAYCGMNYYFTHEEMLGIIGSPDISNIVHSSSHDTSGAHDVYGYRLSKVFEKSPKNNIKKGTTVDKKEISNEDQLLFDFKYYITGKPRLGYGRNAYFSTDSVLNIKIKTLYRSKVRLVSKHLKDLKVVNNNKIASTTMFLDRGKYTIKVYNMNNDKIASSTTVLISGTGYSSSTPPMSVSAAPQSQAPAPASSATPHAQSQAPLTPSSSDPHPAAPAPTPVAPSRTRVVTDPAFDRFLMEKFFPSRLPHPTRSLSRRSPP